MRETVSEGESERETVSEGESERDSEGEREKKDCIMQSTKLFILFIIYI